MQINFSELTDYPPRLLIYVKQTEPSCVSPPELQIIGLDQECTFEVPLRESIMQIINFACYSQIRYDSGRIVKVVISE